MGGPFFEEIDLEFYDTLGHFVERPLALMDASNKPQGRSEFVLNVFFIFSDHLTPLHEGAAVEGADRKFWEPVFIESDDIFFSKFMDMHIRGDVMGLVFSVRAARFWFQIMDDNFHLFYFFDRNIQIF